MYKIVKRSKASQARKGKLQTAHGILETPFFMPVATQGTVKFISTEDVRDLGSKIILSNTYHLMLRPGEKYLKKFGGLHKFADWHGSILTDSGGFQIFSLAGQKNKSEKMVKLSEEGVEFKSYVDGSKHFLTPERCVDIQRDFGVDIAVVLDECVALPAARKYVEESVELTTRWANRAKKYHQKIKGKKPLLFCVVQGGLEKDLRLKSAKDLSALDFDGYNIGGLSVGESNEEMYQVLDYLLPAMPDLKPRYLMGVGYPENIIEAVKRGVDMFDCVIPTREGRHGRLFAFKKGHEVKIAKALVSKKINQGDFYECLNINNAKFANDKTPINPNSKIPELKNLSKAYLYYLIKIGEPLGLRLASLNNLEFYLNLMTCIRKSI
ncbi:MAG: tRNA guanosine(34) transglycosylase Tgt [Patescibacteria group bacterium]|nr:tRNA guanosine(34) transglycosylase Tgt [Patescibacteria group bacterium]